MVLPPGFMQPPPRLHPGLEPQLGTPCNPIDVSLYTPNNPVNASLHIPSGPVGASLHTPSGLIGASLGGPLSAIADRPPDTRNSHSAGQSFRRRPEYSADSPTRPSSDDEDELRAREESGVEKKQDHEYSDTEIHSSPATDQMLDEDYNEQICADPAGFYTKI